MFLHEFREDFVLALELLFQEGDPPVFGVTGASSSGFEGGGGVLEELLLPTVEHCGMDVVLVTEVRNRDAFEEMKPKDGGLLLGTGAFPSLLGHGKTSARDCSLFERFVFPIPTEAEQHPEHDTHLRRTDVLLGSIQAARGNRLESWACAETG